jgi:cellulose synthase/poly-beta-1,6-N-acetylglucosamine synthase-like glycosyltransferase
MLTALQTVFWISALLVGYTYVGYPLTIYALSRLFGRRSQPADICDEQTLSLSLLIAAYNEHSVIAERIENALNMDYPSDKLEIVVASDGSTDGTNEIVRRYADRGVVLLPFPQRRGKSVVLNDAVGRLRGEVVILSDANTMMDRQAARRLARWFSDPMVGAVCGWLDLYDSRTGRNADGVYWRYENFLKRCEGRLHAVLGANGAIYAMRRALYQPIPSDTLIDDLTIPLLAKLRSGCRIVYDKQAVAREETAPDIQSEFGRRARIGAGGFQAIARLWPLLHPRFGWTAFAFLSHKILRWASPFFLVGMLLSNLLLAGDPLYRTLLLGQFAFYALAIAGSKITLQGWVGRLLRLPALFTTVNAALLVGFVRWTLRPQSGVWIRTPRMAST